MKSGVNYIALAIPVFFLMIGVELLIARLSKRSVYRANDAVNDLSCGVMQQIYGAFVGATLFSGYLYVHANHRWFDVPTNQVWAWVALFLGVDFCYYWFHRASHEINLLWAAHVVHHQSEEYNLAVALRQGTFQPSFSWMFYLPLAFVGFEPWMFATMASLNTLYQFWIHTRLIGRLGPLEWVINTPSHHRVHHGRDAKYIDKNHAGTLIIWDRLFGTFQEEEEEPTYGVTKPLESWNPIWANFHYLTELLRVAHRTPRWRDKLTVWIRKPGWSPAEGDGAAKRPARGPDAPKWDPVVAPGLLRYAIFQFAPLVPATMAFLQYRRSLPVDTRTGFALLMLLTLVSLGALLESRRWAVPVELMRLLLVGAVAMAVTLSRPTLTPILLPLAGIFVLVSGAWFIRYAVGIQKSRRALT